MWSQGDRWGSLHLHLHTLRLGRGAMLAGQGAASGPRAVPCAIPNVTEEIQGRS
jgi:hypothetical protein